MKKIILIALLVFLTIGCTKEINDKPNNNKKDTEKPVISFSDNNDIVIYENEEIPNLEYTITDNVDKDLKAAITNNVDTTKPGVYTIKYSVTDKSKNKTEIERKITVMKKINIIDGVTYVKGILFVNKFTNLPSTYNPGVSSEAMNAYTKMKNDSNYPLTIISGFRNYTYQNTLFTNYVNKHGEKEASRFSARAGQSEHQTGLAFDITSLNSDYGETEEGIWLSKNCYKYGFIIRYPKGCEEITGYMYEPWHIRYVGIENATKIYNSNKTLEEYLDMK